MWTKTLAILSIVAVVGAQIPSLGWCPDYQPMANFNMNRFLGNWHEAERYFTVTELGSRCVTTNYEKMPDGRVWVSNEIRNSFTGIKRVVEGQLQVVGRDGEGKISVKYTSLPVPYDSQYTILDTDYDNFAVMWACSGIGPVHTQNAWILTRERLAPGLVLQRAYGVLDKYKITRAFFVKTNQEDCTILQAPIEAIDPTTDPTKVKSSLDQDDSVKKEENKESSVLTVPDLIKSMADKVENTIFTKLKEVEDKLDEKIDEIKIEVKKEEEKIKEEDKKKDEEKKDEDKKEVKPEDAPKKSDKPKEESSSADKKEVNVNTSIKKDKN